MCNSLISPQDLLKAYGSYTTEDDFRRQFSYEYVNNFFIRETAIIPNIPLPKDLNSYFPDGDPDPFVWLERTNARELEVAK